MTGWYTLAAPVLLWLPPESAHRLTIRLLAAAPALAARRADDPILAQRLWGLEFSNPVGLAAGFDKDAEAFEAMLLLGMGFVEVGSVTPRPQPGNPRPRIFRLPDDRAVINRLGFNSGGLDAVRPRLQRYRAAPRVPGIVGVNLGKNKESHDAAADYRAGVKALAPLADYLVINISSPNTPGLRALQDRATLDALLQAVQDELRALDPAGGPPLLVKIAPDLTDADKSDIAEIAVARGIAGLIISNTTITRPHGLAGRHASESGGLSGKPLFEAATKVLSEMYAATDGKLPLIGVGGVSGPDQAYRKIRAGASLVQLYTALIYSGPGLIGQIKQGLAERLRADGFTGIGQAVGADHR